MGPRSGGPQPGQVSRGRRTHRISLGFIVGMLFGLICLALVVYGVYVMAQA